MENNSRKDELIIYQTDLETQIRYWRKHPDIFYENILDIDLLPCQKILLKALVTVDDITVDVQNFLNNLFWRFSQ